MIFPFFWKRTNSSVQGTQTWRKFSFKNISQVSLKPINGGGRQTGSPEMRQQDIRFKFPKRKSIRRIKKLPEQERTEKRPFTEYLNHCRITLRQKLPEHVFSQQDTPFLRTVITPLVIFQDFYLHTTATAAGHFRQS